MKPLPEGGTGVGWSAWLGGFGEAVMWAITGHHSDGTPAYDLGLLWCGRICLLMVPILLYVLVKLLQMAICMSGYLDKNSGKHQQDYGEDNQHPRQDDNPPSRNLSKLSRGRLKLGESCRHLKLFVALVGHNPVRDILFDLREMRRKYFGFAHGGKGVSPPNEKLSDGGAKTQPQPESDARRSLERDVS